MTHRSDSLQFSWREVDADRWTDFERLFESPGGPKACWCMAWRTTPGGSKLVDGASRKAAIANRIGSGTPVGILGYLDGEPVAWCSVAPRSTYRRLVDDEGTDTNIWSVACFFVVRRLRGRGLTKILIEAAIEYAREKGASILEAYPVDRESPSYRFMGFVPSFEAAGFSKVGREGIRRHVMRLSVRRQR